MIQAIILHAPEDAALAAALVGHWPEGQAAAVSLGDKQPRFGEHLLVCVLWSGANAAFAQDVARAISRLRGRAIVYAAAAPPPAIADLGTLIVPMTADQAADAATLADLARDLRNGVLPMPSVSMTGRVRRPARAPRDAPQAAPKSFDPDADIAQRRARQRTIGYVVGAAVGAAVFFGFAAPRIGAWLSRDRPPPAIVIAPHVAAAAAPAPQVAPAPAVAPPVAAPPANDAPPLRGLTPEGDAPGH